MFAEEKEIEWIDMNSPEILYKTEEGSVLFNPELFETDFKVSRQSDVKNKVKQIINSSDLFLGDCDGSDADPAKAVALDYFNNIKLFRIGYLDWLFHNAFDYIKNGRSAESRRWNDFYKKFLKDRPDIVHDLSRRFTAEFVRKTLYKGVLDFYRYLPTSSRYYVTRNIRQFVEPYARILGIQDIDELSFSKFEPADNRIKRSNPHLVTVKGDSDEDIEITEACKHDNIQHLGIYVSNKPLRSSIQGFHLYTSRNHYPLVDIIKS